MATQTKIMFFNKATLQKMNCDYKFNNSEFYGSSKNNC